MTIHVLASLVPKPAHAADVAAALQNLVDDSRKEPGNRRYDLFGPADGSPGFHVMESYDDEAALQVHRDSPHYKAFRAAVSDWLARPPEVKVLTAIDTTTD